MPEDDRSGQAPTAARTFWSGTITFGLVSVPVNLMPAHRSERIPLRMVSPEGRPLSRRYVAPRDGRTLEWDEIVRGYEVEKDRFVVLDDDELERLAPDRTRDIDLRVFVKVSEIDPVHFDRAYYLTPAGSSTKAYRLLARVMEETGRAGIATFVMRAKEYLVAILAENGILRAETLRFAEEIRSPDDVGLPEPVKPDPTEVKGIEKEVAALAEDRFDPEDLVDPSVERLQEIVEKKRRAGRDVVEASEPARPDETAGAQIPDLMEMLQRSLRSSGPTRQSGEDGLADRSKGDLYEQAKELGIPGRSGMTKDQLIEAIRHSA